MLKNIKYYLLLLTVFTFTIPALSQSDNLNKLLEEREELIQDYKHYNSQNSNFWGKKSKKDLLNIIETLKKIINKDTEIVTALRTESFKTRASENIEAVTDRGNIQMYKDRLHDLNRQVASLQNLNKQKSREVTDLQDRLKLSQEKKYSHDRTATMFGIAAGVLLLYVIILHVKLANNKPKKARRKKK